MTRTWADGPLGPSRPLSSRDLHLELSDSRMEIIGADSSRILHPIQTGQLSKQLCGVMWVLEPSCPGLNMDLPFIIHMCLDYLRLLNFSPSQFSLFWIKVICIVHWGLLRFKSRARLRGQQ